MSFDGPNPIKTAGPRTTYRISICQAEHCKSNHFIVIDLHTNLLDLQAILALNLHSYRVAKVGDC